MGAVGEVFGLPEGGAGLFVEGGDGALVAAGGADDLGAIDEDALGVAPAGDFAAEFFHGALPDDFAIGDFDAGEGAGAGERIDEGAIDGGGAARAAAPVVFEDFAERGVPELGALGGVEAEEDLLAVAGAHGEEFAGDDGGAGVGVAGVLKDPEALRAFGGPLLEEAGLGGDVVAQRAAPLRPIEGLRGEGEGEGEECGERAIHGRELSAGRAVWRARCGLTHFPLFAARTPSLEWRAMTPSPEAKHPMVTVGEFYTRHSESLQMKMLGSDLGFDRRIREPTINRPGLALSGFFSYFADEAHPGPRQRGAFVPEEPDAGGGAAALPRRCVSSRIPCIVVSRGTKPPPCLLEEAEAAGIAVFRTPMVTMKFINAATLALEFDFAPTKSEYGSMVDIMGVGTLIRGSSGIGKSECVLGLIERGHSLVSDDITRFRAMEGRELVGTSPELTRHHMEVRGLGVINVMSIFGIGSRAPGEAARPDRHTKGLAGARRGR